MRRLLREPLLHFLLLGAAIFAAYHVVSKRQPDAPTRIVVTLGQIEHLAAGFARTWQRPPTDAELKGLLDDWVHEEIATREAIALGLDQDDSVIRRRLRQKLEFLTNDIVAQAQPTDADLNAYLQAHPDSFRPETRYTFSQVFLNPARHDGTLAADTARLLTQLNQAGNQAAPATLGDSIMLEHDFTAARASDISSQFGAEFVSKLDGLAPGPWQGPVESSYGVHLVRLRERTPGALPALDTVRDTVRRDWDDLRRREGETKYYQELLKRYTVVIEHPAPEAGPKK